MCAVIAIMAPPADASTVVAASNARAAAIVKVKVLSPVLANSAVAASAPLEVLSVSVEAGVGLLGSGTGVGSGCGSLPMGFERNQCVRAAQLPSAGSVRSSTAVLIESQARPIQAPVPPC